MRTLSKTIYCEKCGSKLVRRDEIIRYNSTTGEPTRHTIVTCPKSYWWKKFWDPHPSYRFHSDGSEVCLDEDEYDDDDDDDEDDSPFFRTDG